MEKLTGACIIGQSGGPTAVINASAQGVIQTALKADCITRVLGAAHGIKGVLEDKLYDMSQEDPAELDLLQYTPSSALGSCRYKLADPDVDDTDYKRILEIFEKYNVRYFFYNGGNDSMDTCNKISKYMQKVGYECRIMGVPKTIDNDLNGTDHCPGFASAAKYIATSCAEVWQDAHVYDTGMITIIEIMGRHAGWLAGSAALASLTGCGPDLVYLPETDFDMDKFLADVKAVYEKTGKCMVAVSEGIHYADGTFVSEAKTSATDGFGHAQLGGLAAHAGRYRKAGHRRQGPRHRALPAPALRRSPGLQDRCAGGLAGRRRRRQRRCGGRHRQDGGLQVHPRGRLHLRDLPGAPGHRGQLREEGPPRVDQRGRQRREAGVHRLRPAPHPG